MASTEPAPQDYRTLLLNSRKSQLRLTLDNVKRMEGTFNAAIERIAHRVSLLPDERIGTPWHRAQLQLLADIRAVLEGLKKDYDTLLEAGMTELAQNAANREAATAALVDAPSDRNLLPLQSQKYTLTGGGEVSIEFGRMAVEAVERVATRYYSDGLKLSDRLYKLDTGTKRNIEDSIIQGITEGTSARDMAKNLRQTLLEAGSANPKYDAMRIARTEINNAHREASILSATNGDGVTLKSYISGLRWNLSASHKQLDVCDMYAGYDSGYGAGVYEPSDIPIDHPHGLCFLTDVLVNFPESGIGRKPGAADEVPAYQRNLFEQWINRSKAAA